LVICRYVAGTSPSRGPWTFFEPALAGVPELEVPAEAPAPPARPPLALPEGDPLEPLRRPSWRRVAVAAAAHAEAAGPRVEFAEVGGVEWGRLVHGLLEAAMAGTATTPEQLERLAGWLAF